MNREDPTSVRYIKLGKGGGWERECIETGIVRFGYGTERPSLLEAALEGRWSDVNRMFRDDGKSPGTATQFTNDVRNFFESDRDTLWFTFSGQRLWWALFGPAPPVPHSDGHGTFRRVVGSWRSTDISGRPLTTDRLAGSLTKAAAYRGTTFALDGATSQYVTRRINGEQTPETERATAAITEMRHAARGLMALLEPRDFELLVDLVFTSSGWRRIGEVGRTQKTLDLDVVLPSTGERAFIQVKSATNDQELAEYVGQLAGLSAYSRMFFVYHSGNIHDPGDARVVVVGPEKLAELVVNAGLVGWLIGKIG